MKAQKKAEIKYELKRKTKRVSFNIETEKKLLEKAEKIKNFSNWVKNKLKEI